jgi:uncharacterized protein (TIGR02646 family)
MRKINKGTEPQTLHNWKKANPHGNFSDLTAHERRAIRVQCLHEQYYLCAFCCDRLQSEDDCNNEHIEPIAMNTNRSLDYGNIVASCNKKNPCNPAHGSQYLPLAPLMEECEQELRYTLSGRVEGLTERAKVTIQILNLGDSERKNKALIEKRKAAIQSLLWVNGINPDDGLEDDDLIELVVAD